MSSNIIPLEREDRDGQYFRTIYTLPESCRVCYTCVRECPAKAIRIVDGQATVIHERCIGCGNCVRVCSQHAKVVVDSIPRVSDLISGPARVTALIAPSFISEFTECSYHEFVGALRRLGFDMVHEVAFGADLVGEHYKSRLDEGTARMIATTCPAVVLYVQKYYPELIEQLVDVVSPMVAMSRVVRTMHGKDLRTVFIGPCTAKKSEGMDCNLEGEIDAVLTYKELRCMLSQQGIKFTDVKGSDFDPPTGGKGALFPLSGGMLQAADIKEDLIKQDVVAAEGSNFTTAVKEFSNGGCLTRLLELLACQGCIMGAGTESREPLFRRRARVSSYVRDKLSDWDEEKWNAAMERFRSVDLSREFSNMDQRLPKVDDEDIRSVMKWLGKESEADELNCGACGYETCREHAEAIKMGFAESEMCLPFTIDCLHGTVDQLARSNDELATTQEALMQSERLASMGQLAAGIAHEVNNPLGVVLMYAHLMKDELSEDDPMHTDASVIAEEADRCKKIVSGLLHFARQNKVNRSSVDIPLILQRSLRAVPLPNGINVVTNNDMSDVMAEVDGDQMIQVLTNLITNAYAAMESGGTLTVTLSDDSENISIEVADTGCGISQENIKKIFEPFFTTKQIGKGTGLGLAVSYGIVKMHRGQITVNSRTSGGSEESGSLFTVTLPRRDEAVI